MAVFQRFSVNTAADAMSFIKQFVTDNGWTVGADTTDSGVTWFPCQKNGVTHLVYVAENGTFRSSKFYNRYSSSYYLGPFPFLLGIASDGLTPGACVTTGPLPLPCTLDCFELAGHALFFSAEVTTKIWAQLYSGFVEYSQAGINDVTAVCSGACAVPEMSNSSLGTSEKFLSACGSYAYAGFLYNSDVYGSASSPDYFRIYAQVSTYAKRGDTFYDCGGSYSKISGTLSSKDDETDKYLYLLKWSSLRGWSFNALTGLPVLQPVYLISTDRGSFERLRGTVPDIFRIAASACRPGEELRLGTYAFRMYTLGNSGAGIAVRAN